MEDINMKYVSYPTVLATVAKAVRQTSSGVKGAERVVGNSGQATIAKQVRLRTQFTIGSDKAVILDYYKHLQDNQITFTSFKDKKPKQVQKKNSSKEPRSTAPTTDVMVYAWVAHPSLPPWDTTESQHVA